MSFFFDLLFHIALIITAGIRAKSTPANKGTNLSLLIFIYRNAINIAIEIIIIDTVINILFNFLEFILSLINFKNARHKIVE